MSEVRNDWLVERGGLHDARLVDAQTRPHRITLEIDDEWANESRIGAPRTPGVIELHNAVVLGGDLSASRGGWISEICLQSQTLVVEFCDRNRLVISTDRISWEPS